MVQLRCKVQFVCSQSTDGAAWVQGAVCLQSVYWRCSLQSSLLDSCAVCDSPPQSRHPFSAAVSIADHLRNGVEHILHRLHWQAALWQMSKWCYTNTFVPTSSNESHVPSKLKHACTHMHVCAHMWGAHTHTHTYTCTNALHTHKQTPSLNLVPWSQRAYS